MLVLPLAGGSLGGCIKLRFLQLETDHQKVQKKFIIFYSLIFIRTFPSISDFRLSYFVLFFLCDSILTFIIDTARALNFSCSSGLGGTPSPPFL